MRKIFKFCLLFLCFLQSLHCDLFDHMPMVVMTKRINLNSYPGAYNPSLVKTKDGIFLTFRVLPDMTKLNISKIGIVKLNDALQPASRPELLDTRLTNPTIPSQSEDARIFAMNDNLYLIYNDNLVNEEMIRRDMFVAKLDYVNNHFIVSQPLKLYHPQHYFTVKWQKNWVPFEWNNMLLLSYTIFPHEVLLVDFCNGTCHPINVTNNSINWPFGKIRGGTPALLVDGEYLSFFHSPLIMSSPYTDGIKRFHYFMGAYKFSANPPFEVTHVSPCPIIGENFYTNSDADKRVIFPGGFVVEGPFIYLAYGKDDQEIWIAKIDKKLLNDFLVPIQ